MPATLEFAASPVHTLVGAETVEPVPPSLASVTGPRHDYFIGSLRLDPTSNLDAQNLIDEHSAHQQARPTTVVNGSRVDREYPIMYDVENPGACYFCPIT